MLNLARSVGVLASVLAASVAFAQPSRHILELQSPGGPLPVELILDGGRAVILNGDERIEVERFELSPRPRSLGGGRLYTLGFDGFGKSVQWIEPDGADEIRVRGEPGLPGWWRTERGSGLHMMPVAVRPYDGTRFGPVETPAGVEVDEPGPAADFAGRWAVDFSDDDEMSIGVFEVDEDGIATGTFLNATGDYRYLAGRVDGDLMRLSVFDGAHGFLFHVRMRDDGTIAGDFWSGSWHHETFTGVRDDTIELADAFETTTARASGSEIEQLAFLGLDGTKKPIGAIAPPGTARMVLIFGSWCPNCHDATEYLKELNERYGPRGLKISGLAFEHSMEPSVVIPRVEQYLENEDVPWPVLIAGLSDKDEASAAFPAIDRVRAFPTTIFIAPSGEVAAVHTGFTGPATGQAYVELRERFESLIEEMLASR